MSINVKSVPQILGEMIRKIDADTPLTDVSEGSIVGTILEAAALQDFQSQLSVLKVLESSNLQSLIGTDLDNKANEMTLPNGVGGFGRFPAKRATGTVTISSPFTKVSTALYIGKPAPFAGGFNVHVQTSLGFTPTGQIYIGRGTINEEGPIPYTQIIDNGTFATLVLSPSSPLVRNHNYSEPVVLAQGGNRAISSGTTVRSPAAPGVRPVDFTVDTAVVIIDGESSIDVGVTCTVFGEEGNVAGGSIKLFVDPPFPDAQVTNALPLANGAASENDEALRMRIKNYVATLSRGTRIALNSSLMNLRDPITGKTITSLNIVEPADISQPAKIYVDDGTGLEPTILGQDYELLLNNAAGQEVLFRTANYPITPSTALGTRPGPYVLKDGMTLTVILDGIVEQYRVNTIEYVNLNAVQPNEIVRAFNSQATLSGTQKIGFRTAGGGTLISVFDLQGDAEKLQILPGDLQELLGLPVEEIRPIFLYKSNKLLSFKGNTATVQSANYPFPALTSGDLQNVGIKVDGVAQYFSISNTDFIPLGSTIATASLSHWATVFKTKVAGLNVYVAGSQLYFATWQENSANGSVEILSTLQNGSPASWISVNKLFTPNQVLSSVGSASDFEINRVTGQIKLLKNPEFGSSVTIASKNTRAELISNNAPTGQFATGPTTFGESKLVVAADGDFELRTVPATGIVSVEPEILSANNNLVRLQSAEINLFANAQINDYLYINPNTAVANFMTNRLNSFFRIRRKGLNTTGVNLSFPNTGLELEAVGPNVVVTVQTASPHAAVVGSIISLSSAVLTPADVTLQGLLNASHTVTVVENENVLKFEVVYGSLTSPTGLATYNIARNAFLDIEVSELQKQAFLGEYLAAEASFSIGSSTVTLFLPEHSLTGGFLNINALSPTLASVFPALPIPGVYPVTSIVDKDHVVVDFAPYVATGIPIAGASTVDATYTTVFSTYDISPGMFHMFKCENTFPQVIKLGTLPTTNADQLVSLLNTAVGLHAFKESPRKVGLRSNSYDVTVSNLAVLAVVGGASTVFSPTISEAIQSHAASKLTKFVNGGIASISGTILPTESVDGYPTRGALVITPVNSLITDTLTNPSTSMAPSVVDYPQGLQEMGLSGRGYGLVTRFYNNDTSAPFPGFARGVDVVQPVAQSVSGTNTDDSTLGLRLSDLPLTSVDTLVVEMDLDPVNKTTAIPLFKRALVENMQPFGAGSGAQIEFTLKDPDDETTPNVYRPFFDINSIYRDFDFTDFNVLVKPTLVHTNYPSLPFVGNPADAFVVKSTQYGKAHELRFSMLLPENPNVTDIVVAHKNFEENGRTVLHLLATLCSQPTIIGTDVSTVYTVTPSNLTGPNGAAIVQLSITALSINLSGLFVVGNILKIGGNQPYSGAYLIIDTPNFDTIVVASPGIRAASYSPVVYDGSIAPIASYPLAAKTMQDVATAVGTYYAGNPIVEFGLSNTTNPAALILYPTFYTHGNSIVNNSIVNNALSYDYHAKKAPYGTLLHIHTYDAAGNKIIALNQSSESALPVQSQIQDTGFPLTYENSECVLVPANNKALNKWLNYTAISPLSIQSEIKPVQTESFIQINSPNLGSSGAVRITGVSGNSQTTIAKTSPFKTEGALKIRTDFSTAQSFATGSIAKVFNATSAPIYRPYRTSPNSGPGSSALTLVNQNDITTWFRTSTVVGYTRPTPGTGRFVYRKSASGLLGGESVEITKLNSFIAKIEVVAGSGKLDARVGDMLILRGDLVAAEVDYTSIFDPANQCRSSISDMTDQYIGYPVVHVASDTEVHVIAPNIVDETVTARTTVVGASNVNPFDSVFDGGSGYTRITASATTFLGYSVGDVIEVTGFLNAANNGRFTITEIDVPNQSFVAYVGRPGATGDENGIEGVVVVRQMTEFMFLPMLKAEKNVKTTYNAGAITATDWAVSPAQEMFYRIKTIGNGFAYADFSFTSHYDMYLEQMGVNTGDTVAFSNAFASANRGRFKILAHNGSNAVVFYNPEAVDEVIDTTTVIENGIIGDSLWKQGPFDNNTLPGTEKRLIRFYDSDSVFENDVFVLSSPLPGVTTWFDSSLVGSWPITKIGINKEFDVFVEASITLATSTTQNITLGTSRNSLSFKEGAPLETFKLVSGYTHSDANEIDADLYVLPQTEDHKISPAYTTKLEVVGKLGFDSITTIGVDGYKYYGGLISEAHKVIDGSPTNTITYPGVRAAGTSIEVQAPLTKSISMAIELIPRDGVSLNAIKNPVKSVITGYIKTLGVGREVVLSEIVKQVQNVPGVKSVVILSTLPLAADGIIKMGSYEVPRIERAEDILI